ncbi:MAG TPA: class I SAM-dependent methyltransferase [Solirubrobacterales bacterium]|jgi:SAM-dependent methyltransferase|nr:class I SAM-dependent methyltransferase [Solirubrobacterales bacterium]
MLPSSRPDCPWCGTPLRDGRRLRGRTRCAACGTATTDPWPSPVELEAAYSGWYRPGGGRFSGVGDRILRRTRASLSQRIDRIAPGGPVLDVGAGDGALLSALRGRGREAVGLERWPNEPGMHKSDVANQEQGAWAAVVFWHSLEHLTEPGRAVEATAALLLPKGVAIVAVPNAASLQARVFGDRWLALDLPRHLVHLTAASLLDKLRSSGLRVERVSYLRGGQVVFGWLHGLVGLLPGHPSLYDAIRRPQARSEPMGAAQRLLALAAAVLLLAPAALASLAEAALGRGGTIYVEARRA